MSDIYLSGEINNSLAQSLGWELNWAESPITIHLNSAGGDPFAAIAIGHSIRHSDKEITISVEGLCASAAILILCCGRRVVSAFNSLFMIHGPSVMLEDSYNLAELEKIKSSMEKVHESISKTLATRVKDVDLNNERWLNADEALELGLIDEITQEAVDIKMDAAQKVIIAKGFQFALKGAIPELKQVEAFKVPEVNRLRALAKMKSTNAAVNAVIDVAIERGHSVKDVKEYIEAIKKASPVNNLRGLIADQQESGSDGVLGGTGAVDMKAAQMAKIVDAANRRIES